jgi:hypothetical protein
VISFAWPVSLPHLVSIAEPAERKVHQSPVFDPQSVGDLVPSSGLLVCQQGQHFAVPLEHILGCGASTLGHILFSLYPF